jgi:hypothetical protein
MFAAPAIRGRFSRQQEASVPPEGFPQFSCMTLHPLDGSPEASPERVFAKRRKTMTTTTENTETRKTKKPADRYIFEGDGNQKKIVGSVYFHQKGNGMNILIGNKRYSAFAPKAKPAAQAPAGQPAAEGKGA